MADPAAIIERIRLSATDYKRATPDTMGQQVAVRLLLADCSDLLAALTPPATPTQGASAEDAAVLDDKTHEHIFDLIQQGVTLVSGNELEIDTDLPDRIAAVLARMAGKVPPLTDAMRRAAWIAQYRHWRDHLRHDATDAEIEAMADTKVADPIQRENDIACWNAAIAAALESPR